MIEQMISNLVFLSIGVCIGFVMGWSHQARQYAQEARDEAHHAVEETERLERFMIGEQGKVAWDTIVLGIVIVITAFAAIMAGFNAQDLRESQRQAEVERLCDAEVSAEFVSVLSERTTLTSDIALADVQANQAFLKLISLVQLAEGRPNREERIRAAFDEYENRLDKYLRLIDEARAERVEKPYPEPNDFEECLTEGGVVHNNEEDDE